MTQTQHKAVQEMREQLLNTEQGRRVLCRQLMSMGLFQGADAMLTAVQQDPASVRTVIQAVGILEAMCVWNKDTFMALLAKMAELPIPQIQEITSGETA